MTAWVEMRIAHVGTGRKWEDVFFLSESRAKSTYVTEYPLSSDNLSCYVALVDSDRSTQWLDNLFNSALDEANTLVLATCTST